MRTEQIVDLIQHIYNVEIWDCKRRAVQDAQSMLSYEAPRRHEDMMMIASDDIQRQTDISAIYVCIYHYVCSF